MPATVGFEAAAPMTATAIAWHRRGFGRFWASTSRRPVGYVARVCARPAEDQNKGTKIATMGIRGPAATTRTSKSIGARTTAANTPRAHLPAFGHDRVFIQILHGPWLRGFRARSEIPRFFFVAA
jgi:hypothetical protein